MAFLVIYDSDKEILRFNLNRSSTTLGRSSMNDIVLPDDLVNEFAFEILKTAKGYSIYNIEGKEGRGRKKIVKYEILKGNEEFYAGKFKISFKKDMTVEKKLESDNLDTCLMTDFINTDEEDRLKSAVLRIVKEDKVAKTVALSGHVFTIGKDVSNRLILKDPFVSSFHCRLFVKQGKYYIRDLDSTNGTKLNGSKVVEAEIPDDSVIKAGKTEIFFKYEEDKNTKNKIVTKSVPGMIADSSEMVNIVNMVHSLANESITVLINGESGSGKELIAQGLHKLSKRSKGPFVAINCGAISRDLVESELFGHEKGAFTGAVSTRIGAFESANRGTLFLDEIGEISLEMQVKLLRVLETGELKRVGGRLTIKPDVRIVAATNRDLKKEVELKNFREDLYFRLCIIPIKLPPLRKRISDIYKLAAFFAKQFAPERKIKFDAAAISKLKAYNWPGNIRELKNVISRTLIMSNQNIIKSEDIFIDTPDLSERIQHASIITSGKSLDEIEKEVILNELDRSNGKKKKAAKVLGISISTLYKKLSEYDIDL